VNSLNPHRIEGQKTAAFEVCEDLGDAPDALFIPVGNAGNITAYWRGFVEASASGLATRRPRMYGFQAEGAAPIVRGEAINTGTTYGYDRVTMMQETKTTLCQVARYTV
jgi:threonine synthase